VLDAKGVCRGTVLVMHGIRDQKTSMLGLAQELSSAGFRAVLIDLRGHGASTGKFLTYGFRDRFDQKMVIDQLTKVYGALGPVGIYGPSYGGAVALQTAALDSRIKAVVTVATFASLPAILPNYARRSTGLMPPQWFISSLLKRAGRFAGFDPYATCNSRAIQRTRAHVLLIHGLADEHIYPDNSRQLFKACSASRCMLWEIPQRDHVTVMDKLLLAPRAIAFFKQHLGA